MKKIILIASMLIPSTAFSWSTETSDESWRSGWGQGTAEAEITNGSGNRIYVACEDGSGISSSISFSIVGDGPKSDSIIMIFDSSKPETISVDHNGNITSDSRAGDSTFRYVIEKLKQHSSVYVRFTDGRESNFTLKGAAQAIGDCHSTF